MANPEIRRACPLCERDNAVSFLKKASLQLVRCRDCSMIYANPVDAELASGKFYDRLGTPFYLAPDKLESDYAPVRFERELRLFRRFCPGGEVLDVGCSTGAFLFQLKSRFSQTYEVTGTDVTSDALDYAEQKGINVIRGLFLDHEFGTARFDAVTFWAVMEHLVEPKLFLTKAASLLKPGGYCFVLVPNLRSLAVRLLGAKYRYLMPDHVNYFTVQTLRKFAACESVFEIVAQGSSHFNPLVIAQDFRGGAERVAEEDRARLLKRTTAYKQNPWLKPIKWLYSATERMLATMNLADNLYIVLRKGR
ncbi:MAG: class I SAM-dependent methyltransferase [Verrucomicrobia bacterium]|nr:class I SAM-dependent methyltransferase [Verrucomicrobiota bacterium]